MILNDAGDGDYSVMPMGGSQNDFIGCGDDSDECMDDGEGGGLYYMPDDETPFHSFSNIEVAYDRPL